MKNPSKTERKQHIQIERQATSKASMNETWDQRLWRLLPAYVLPPLKQFVTTSVRDVSELADAYINDPLVYKIFKEKGTHTIISNDEQSFVDALTETNENIDWSHREPELANVAQALARRVIAREYTSSYCQAAQDFIADRLFDRPDNHSPLKPYRDGACMPTAAELVDAARFFYSQERFRTLFFDHCISKIEQSDDDILYMHGLQADYIRTHGLRVRVGISGAIRILDALRYGALRSLETQDVFDYALDPAGVTGSRESEARLMSAMKKNIESEG